MDSSATSQQFIGSLYRRTLMRLRGLCLAPCHNHMGNGVAPDDAEALRWLQLAAATGSGLFFLNSLRALRELRTSLLHLNPSGVEFGDKVLLNSRFHCRRAPRDSQSPGVSNWREHQRGKSTSSFEPTRLHHTVQRKYQQLKARNLPTSQRDQHRPCNGKERKLQRKAGTERILRSARMRQAKMVALPPR